MKRNIFGMNMDEGIALVTDEEFERLFVDPQSSSQDRLAEWLDTGENAIMFGGQIGCGKTTLIEYAFRKSGLRPHIEFQFDTGSLNLSEIDSWAIVFAEVFRYMADIDQIDAYEIPSEFKTLLGDTPDAWRESISMVRLKTFSEASLEKNKRFAKLLESIRDYLPKFFESMIEKVGSETSSPLILFASGVDKFEPATPAYFSLSNILQVLGKHKTLFEVNAVHLFSGDSWGRNLEKDVVPAMKDNHIGNMLKKRLGRYFETYAKEIPLIEKFSGGMPRQALRIMDSFLSVRKKSKDDSLSFQRAIQNVNRDFFAFSQRPDSALMKNVDENRYLETDLISLPGDQEGAKRAVFGNWIVLGDHIRESRWKASVNPMVKDVFVDVDPEEPERILLKEYAKQTGVSPYGLDIDMVGRFGTDSTASILIETVESPSELNVTEILDCISSALLSERRADRVVVAYESEAVADVARAYFEAKSNSYEYQIWVHRTIREGTDESPLMQMLRIFSEETANVYSFEFEGVFYRESLDELNLRRDSLIDKQLLWWVSKDKLHAYFERWTQLRQLFQVYVLEEDLTRSLKIEDIEADLAFMEELAEMEGTAPFSYVENLKIVLEYLKGKVDG